MVKWKSGAAVCVVMASGGYPGSYPKGIAITGLEEASKLEDVVVFHAGTKEVDGQIVTNGGRVLGVTAVDETIAKAKERAYGAVERIHFEGAQYRKDIALESAEPLIDHRNGLRAVPSHISPFKTGNGEFVK